MTSSEYLDTMISDPALGVETNNPDLMETIAAAAKPYFKRGLSAVQEQRTIRTFDEAADIIKANFIKNGIPVQLAEPFACVFARAYIAGVAHGCSQVG